MQNLGKYYSSFKGRDTNLCKKESKIISCILFSFKANFVHKKCIHFKIRGASSLYYFVFFLV